MAKLNKINMNEFAKSVTMEEGGRVNLSIAQVKEVISIFCEEITDNYSDSDVIFNITRIATARKNRKKR